MTRESSLLIIALSAWALAFAYTSKGVIVRKILFGVIIVTLAATTGLLIGAGIASAHQQTGETTITCATVSGTFSGFSTGDHPIIWHVKIGSGAYQTVTTTDFVGASGTATANITSLTSGLLGVPTPISAYASWTTSTGATTTTTVTCGEPPTTTTIPPTTTTVPPTTTTVPPTTTTRPPVPSAPPAPPVRVPARFTG